MDIQINNNIDEVKPKVLGPFTGTQVICVAIAAAIEMAGVFVINSLFPGTLISYILPVPFAIIPLALGWADELLHMSLKDYYELVWKRSRTHPMFRPYKYHNYLESLEAKVLEEMKAEQEEFEKQQNKGQVKKKAKKPPVDIPPELKRYD